MWIDIKVSESVTREVKQLKRTVLFILVKANIFFISQKKKRFLLISFRGFWCRKLPPFETSFSLDFIFVSLFPILYLFLLLLCLTRGFSSSAVDCVFFFKVFYKLHFFVRFFFVCIAFFTFLRKSKEEKAIFIIWGLFLSRCFLPSSPLCYSRSKLKLSKAK